MTTPEKILLISPNVRMVSQFRSTWLTSSLHEVRARGLEARYLALLEPKHHQPVLESVAGVWLPIEVAMAHYGALDQLGIAKADAFDIGAATCRRVHNTVLGTAIKLARGSGATPWAGLSLTGRLWERTWVGGAVGLTKLGPKEALVEVVQWPPARFEYIRAAFAGMLLGLVELLCRRAFIRPVPNLVTDTSLGHKVQWV